METVFFHSSHQTLMSDCRSRMQMSPLLLILQTIEYMFHRLVVQKHKMINHDQRVFLTLRAVKSDGYETVPMLYCTMQHNMTHITSAMVLQWTTFEKLCEMSAAVALKILTLSAVSVIDVTLVLGHSSLLRIFQ